MQVKICLHCLFWLQHINVFYPKIKCLVNRILKKIFIFTLGLFVILVAAIIIVGGGFGEKQLPNYPVFTKPLFFAHRGVVAPQIVENTKSSIQHARQLNFNAVEFDIQQTADGIFVLYHDKDGDRLLNKDIIISQLNYADLKNFYLYDIDSSKTILSLTTLNEVFEKNKDSIYYYLDMKGHGRKSYFTLGDEIFKKIQKHKLEANILVASASILFIAHLEFYYPQINTVLEGFNKGKEWIYYWIPKNFRPDFVSSFAQNIDENHIEWLKENNLLDRKIVYGVDETNYEKMKQFGISKMIIDYGIYLDKDLN